MFSSLLVMYGRYIYEYPFVATHYIWVCVLMWTHLLRLMKQPWSWKYIICFSQCVWKEKLNLPLFFGYKCQSEQCEGMLAPLTGSIPPLDTGGTGASHSLHLTITTQHLMVLDAFLLHHSYITGYTPSSKDLTLHQALMKQYPQLCIPLKAQSKCGNKDTSHYDVSPFPLSHTFPHLSRWALHIKSITKEEKSLLPKSDQTIEEILGNLMDQVKARISTKAWHFFRFCVFALFLSVSFFLDVVLKSDGCFVFHFLGNLWQM